MAKLYTIALVDISELRDSKLAQLFGEENQEVFTGKWEFLWTTNSQITKIFNLNLKTYKTINGANKAAALINQTYPGKNMKLRGGYWDSKTNRYVSSIPFDSFTKKMVPLEITQEWNSLIDTLVNAKKKDFDKQINKLISKKVTS